MSSLFVNLLFIYRAKNMKKKFKHFLKNNANRIGKNKWNNYCGIIIKTKMNSGNKLFDTKLDKNNKLNFSCLWRTAVRLNHRSADQINRISVDSSTDALLRRTIITIFGWKQHSNWNIRNQKTHLICGSEHERRCSSTFAPMKFDQFVSSTVECYAWKLTIIGWASNWICEFVVSAHNQLSLRIN